MDAVQKLIELEELKALKARYFFYLDTKDWEAWTDQFAPHATLKWDSAPSTRGRDGQTSEVCVGREQIGKQVRGMLDPAQTVHQGFTPILELTSDTTARGIWAMEDIVVHADSTLHAYGHYRETYEKIDGKWKFASVHLTRLSVTMTLR